MKKSLHLGTVIAILLALVPATGLASDPYTVDLLAGQDTDVGDVTVSNDASNFYVTYNLDAPWCMTMSHLHVADDPVGIPQKNGNPIPGQFDYSTEHDCVGSYTYTIPLNGFGAGDNIVIAAHADVTSPVDGCYETVWQIGYVEEMVAYPEGPYAGMTLYTNYADEFNWPDATEFTAGLSLAVVEPPFTDPFVVGSTPNAEFPYNSNFVRGYATDFDVQWDGHLHFGGVLTVSWSPGQSAAEMKVVSPGFTGGVFNQVGVPSPGQGYFLDTYPVFQDVAYADPLGEGTHTINFQHTMGDGTFWDWIRLERPCEQMETAWGDGVGFPGKNWATYFEYQVQDMALDTSELP